MAGGRERMMAQGTTMARAQRRLRLVRMSVVAGAALGFGTVAQGGEAALAERVVLAEPGWIAPVLDGAFDAAYQDTRSQVHIHGEIARALADARYLLAGGSPDDEGERQFCFAPGTELSPEVLAIIEQAMRGGFEDRFVTDAGEWFNPAPNTATVITWSIVPDGLLIPDQDFGTGISSLFSTMGTQFADEGGVQVFIDQIAAAFARWSELTGLSYQFVSAPNVLWDDGAAWGTNGNDTTRGDVRICMRAIDGPSGILAFNRFPPAGSDMVIDEAERWDDNNPPTYRFLRNTVMHEHGHGMGLRHICPAAGFWLMEPLSNDAIDGAQQDDIRVAQFLYGDAFEPNNTTATATNVGGVVPGSTLTIGQIPAPDVTDASLVSLSEGSLPPVPQQPTYLVRDRDNYRLTLDQPVLVNLSLVPQGSTYVSTDQRQGCNGGGPTVNARVQLDLRFQVFGPNGTTNLLDRNQTPIGSNETFNGLLLPPGVSFLQVRSNESNAELGPQMNQAYTLSVTGQVRNMRVTASDNVQGRVEASWPAIPNAAFYRLRRNTVNNIAGSTVLFTSPDPTVRDFDDETAVPLTQYFYWVEVQQTMNSQWVATQPATDGEPGMRAANNLPPVANAGPDITVADTAASGFGFEPVNLNGSLSNDPDGTITGYFWFRGSLVVLEEVSGTVLLPVGTTNITLIVLDNNNVQDDDVVVVTVTPRQCDSIDFNNDGSIFDPQDISAFLSVYSEGPCIPSGATCNDIDFNNDGSIFDPQDIAAFLSRYSEGPCL